MAGQTGVNERIVDLDAAGDALPDLVEDAARRAPCRQARRDEAGPMVESNDNRRGGDERDQQAVATFRSGFSDLTDEEIQRETVRAIAEVRTGASPVGDDELRAVLAAVRANFADQSDEDIERETAKALAEARADLRAERSGMRKAS